MIILQQQVARILSKCYRRTAANRFSILSNRKEPTAAIIVVGDELLKGLVKDTNSNYASKLLYQYGVRLQKVSIVPDVVEDITAEIKRVSEKFQYIFTTGGIGPTHDDVTYQAVALAFDDTLWYHPFLVRIVKNYCDSAPFPSASYKMAYVPTKSQLKFLCNNEGKPITYPCVQMENIYIFPGSPEFFKVSFDAMCRELFKTLEKFKRTEVFVNCKEESIVDTLNEVVNKFPCVSFGSYPENHRYYKVRITIESKNKDDTFEARKYLCSRLPAAALVKYDSAPELNSLRKYEELLINNDRQSLYTNTVNKFLNYYEHHEETWILFENNSESIIMLHLAHIASNKLGQLSTAKVRGICVTLKGKWFFRKLSDRYNVDICHLSYAKGKATTELQRWIVSRPESRITLLIGKRENGNVKQRYDILENWSKHNSDSVQIQFPLIDWTNEDVTSIYESLCLPRIGKDRNDRSTW